MTSYSNSRAMLMNVDARTRLAGSNRMELLLFTLGTEEMFGINVFKVREVTDMTPVTVVPNLSARIEGVVSLRGNVIPVIALARWFGGDARPIPNWPTASWCPSSISSRCSPTCMVSRKCRC